MVGAYVAFGSAPHALQEEIAQTADEGVALGEDEAVAADGPHQGDDGHHGEALHHGAQDVALAHPSRCRTAPGPGPVIISTSAALINIQALSPADWEDFTASFSAASCDSTPSGALARREDESKNSPAMMRYDNVVTSAWSTGYLPATERANSTQ